MANQNEHTDESRTQVMGDVKALKDNDYPTDDVGTGNKTMKESDVAKLTETSSSKASAAGHTARDDMEADGTMGIRPNRHDK